MLLKNFRENCETILRLDDQPQQCLDEKKVCHFHKMAIKMHVYNLANEFTHSMKLYYQLSFDTGICCLKRYFY